MDTVTMNILDKGINLYDIGINNYAYSWEYVNDVLDEIEKLNLTILGGDVYAVEDSELFLTFDSWYYTLVNTSSDCSLSIDKAKEYIGGYLEKNGKNFYFSFVFY
ncbi:Imm40 family immunity protein [Streptococcus ruminantium]|uniref:Imm40 family immunity protein n=1 Tax=Streptococcus ruminantium TaxID=1917441 RepID=UPI0012DC4BC8|nr:Imm40 family immunity protein [Streptococcus ruminantium]